MTDRGSRSSSLGYIDSYNLFGFATYDPINGYDPFGLANKGYVDTFLEIMRDGHNNLRRQVPMFVPPPDVDTKEQLIGVMKSGLQDLLLSPVALILTKRGDGEEPPDSFVAAMKIKADNPSQKSGMMIGDAGTGLIKKIAINLIGKSSKKIAKNATKIHNVWKKGSNWKSKPQFGHTFTKHGAGKKNTQSLKDTARDTNIQQGQFLNNEKAAEIMAQNKNFSKNFIDIDIPPGLGQVIKPDGSIVPVTRARLIPNSSRTGFRSGYPLLE